ncbi:hypothetical protein HYQ44_013440 [Verticillium longisporum]|nr:hypothetical protein HYQ44_013440 [Verticillium longisporum]
MLRHFDGVVYRLLGDAIHEEKATAWLHLSNNNCCYMEKADSSQQTTSPLVKERSNPQRPHVRILKPPKLCHNSGLVELCSLSPNPDAGLGGR